MQTSKPCSLCKIEKSFSGFNRNKSNADGLQSQCADCRAENRRKVVERNRSTPKNSGPKTCFRCKTLLPSSAFNRRDSTRDGLDSVCRGCGRADKKIINARNSATRVRKVQQWKAENPELAAKHTRDYSQKYPEKRNASASKRRSSKLLRSPKWLTSEDFAAIEFLYALARALEIETGVKHHVDHIYPLQGQYVSGLHVPSNLQILTAEENCRKFNKWAPE